MCFLHRHSVRLEINSDRLKEGERKKFYKKVKKIILSFK